MLAASHSAIKMLCRLQISFILVSISIVLVKCDYYSSVTGLENLLETEALMVDSFEKYLRAEELKNSHLRNFLADVETALEFENNTLGYYENPINSFKTLKRMTRDWREFDYSYFKSTNAEEYATSLKSWQEFQPNLEDLIGAAKGIARLQQTYGLETSHIASGSLMGIKASLAMFASDCHDLGKSLLQAADPINAASWLIEARLRLAQETQANTVLHLSNLTDEAILAILKNATMQIGSTKLVHLLANDKLIMNSNAQPAVEGWSQGSTYFKEDRLSRHRVYKKTTIKHISTDELYKKTCSGKLHQTPAEKRYLRCRYQDNEVPFCLIAPFKVEELSFDPYVAYYHESIYESEIDNIFAAAESMVQRSAVGENQFEVSEIRTSKNTWLFYKEHDFMEKLEQRLVDMTGLSMKTAEALQVANYGIGGHYDTHHDFYEKGESKKEGNRILTALFYLNDVELGGATAFPYLRLAVQPIRRSLVMWYNLHESLEEDFRTLHAGCPVVKGSKWICNEWFNSLDQEFYRPCDLEADGYKSIEYEGLDDLE